MEFFRAGGITPRTLCQWGISSVPRNLSSLLARMFAAEQSPEHGSPTSPIVRSFGNNSRYFTSLPSSSLSFDVPFLPAAQSHYSLPLPVGLCDVTAERDICYHHYQPQPVCDLDPMTSLALTGSRSLRDPRNDNAIFSQQRVSAQPAQRFKSLGKHRGLSLLSY